MGKLAGSRTSRAGRQLEAPGKLAKAITRYSVARCEWARSRDREGAGRGEGPGTHPDAMRSVLSLTVGSVANQTLRATPIHLSESFEEARRAESSLAGILCDFSSLSLKAPHRGREQHPLFNRGIFCCARPRVAFRGWGCFVRSRTILSKRIQTRTHTCWVGESPEEKKHIQPLRSRKEGLQHGEHPKGSVPEAFLHGPPCLCGCRCFPAPSLESGGGASKGPGLPHLNQPPERLLSHLRGSICNPRVAGVRDYLHHHHLRRC